jgi:hypothetical protein
LSATCIPLAALSITPDPADLGYAAGTPATRSGTLTVKNTGAVSVTIASVNITVAPGPPSDISVFSKGFDACTSNTLAPGGTCVVQINITSHSGDGCGTPHAAKIDVNLTTGARASSLVSGETNWGFPC